MRSALVLALVAGCGFQVPGGTAADGGPPDDADPDGMDADAPIDMPIDMVIKDDDQDGDGVPDSTDNCDAVMNPDQRDHDLDLFGDACDRCPHLASTNDPDGDMDGVGDACDPRPTNNADRRVGWYPFDDPSEINGWVAQGTWTVAGGYLVQASTGLTGIAPPANVNVPYFMTELVIDDPNTNFEIGLSVPVNNSAFECAVIKTGANVNIRARDVGAGGAGSTSNSWTGTNGVGDRIRLTLDLGSEVDCLAVQGMANVHPVANTNGDPTGRTYVGTLGVEARFDYLFVVDQAP